MPLEAISNAQFMSFVNFAREAEANGNGKTIARLGKPNEQGVHTISVQSADKVGALFRSAHVQRSNDAIRAEFKACVVEMFGGARNVPKSVVNALRLKDFGEGKPLTARRILEVTRAIEPLAERFARVKAVAVAKLGRAAEDPETMELVDLALKRCLADADAADIVADSIENIVLKNGEPRSEDDVFARVDKFVESAKDLRKAAKGNPRVVEIGKRFFASYGHPLEPGMISNIVRTLGSMSVGPLKRLTADAGPGELHKAVSRLTTNINKTLGKVGARDLLDGADQIDVFKGFLVELALERCGTNTIRRISEAMRSENATSLYAFYESIYDEKLTGEGAGENLKHNASNFADQDKNVLMLIVKSAKTLLGQNEAVDFDYDKEVSDALFHVDWVPGALADVYDRAEESGTAQRDELIAMFVNGKGPGAQMLREVYTDKIGEFAFRPKPYFLQSASNIGKSMLNWTVASECRLMAQGNLAGTKFAAGLATNLAVTLPDGSALSKDLDEACDQIASFVTNGRVKGYAALAGEDRTKAHVVMSMLSMEMAKIAPNAHFIAASEDETFEPAVTEASDAAKDSHALALTVGRDGELVFTYNGEKSLKSLTRKVENDDGEMETKTVNVARGSKSTAKLTFTLKQAELERLAKLDFTQFDDAEATEARQGGQIGPVDAVKLFKPEFKLDGLCVVEYKATLAG